MSYVIYDIKSTRLVTNKTYDALRSAKSAVTRGDRKGEWARADVAIEIASVYYDSIEAKVERINMMSGKPYMESINTPSYCSPSSESYWSF